MSYPPAFAKSAINSYRAFGAFYDIAPIGKLLFFLAKLCAKSVHSLFSRQGVGKDADKIRNTCQVKTFAGDYCGSVPGEVRHRLTNAHGTPENHNGAGENNAERLFGGLPAPRALGCANIYCAAGCKKTADFFPIASAGFFPQLAENPRASLTAGNWQMAHANNNWRRKFATPL